MSLRIAFDCDGVIADLDAALAGIVARLFGEAPPDPDPLPDTAAEGASADEENLAPPRGRGLTPRQQREIWDVVGGIENFWETLDETEPGIVARIARAARERRWEVVFITRRPTSAGDPVQVQTQRWLSAHGYELPSVYVVKGDRGKIADALALDVVVDDRPENCLDVKLGSRARAILVWTGGADSLPPNATRLGIESVPSASACLDLLFAEPGGKQGLLSRVRQMIRG